MNQANLTEPRLKFRFFGGCKFQCEEKNVRLDTAKTSALLTYLALQSRPQPRHKLIGLFWGDQPEANALPTVQTAPVSLPKEPTKPKDPKDNPWRKFKFGRALYQRDYPAKK